MAILNVNGLPVISGQLSMPRVGAWTSTLFVDASAPIDGPVVLEAPGGMTWRGWAHRAGVFAERMTLKIVGGAGGLGKELVPRSYVGIQLQTVLTDLLGEAGEVLSPTSSPSATSRLLPAWARHAGISADALKVLTDAHGLIWRVLADGTVWVGVETWHPGTLQDYEVLDDQPHSGRVELGVEVPSLVPGETFLDRHVSRVEWELEPNRFRLIAWSDSAEASADDSGAAIERIVDHLTARVDFFAQYPCRMVAQNADGSLELRPDDVRLPAMSRVPIRYGIPDVVATVSPGARVLLGFEGGNPAHPVATLWESGSILSLVLAGGTKGAARVDDSVACGAFVYTPGVSLVWTLPNGTVLTNTGSISGKVSEGSSKVKVG